MGNPRYKYCRYEGGDREKMLNEDGNENGIPTPNSTHYHPYFKPNKIKSNAISSNNTQIYKQHKTLNCEVLQSLTHYLICTTTTGFKLNN